MTQNDQILRHLKRGREISPLQALDLFHTMRLAARIADLKRAGHRIEAKMVRLGKRSWASYRLA